MAIVSLTRREIRQALLPDLLRRDDYILAANGAPFVPTAAETSSTTFGNLANVFTVDHWKGGEIRGETAANAVVTARITNSTVAGVLTHTTIAAEIDYVGDPGTIEVLRADHAFADFDSIIRQANDQAGRKIFIDATDYSVMTEPACFLYPTPADWVALAKVEVNTAQRAQDRYVDLSPSGHTSVSFQATTTRRGQAVQIIDVPRIAAVWLRLRLVGTLTGTCVLELRTNNSGTPATGSGGILMSSATVNATAIGSDWTWVRFAFSATPPTAYNTVYHVSLNPAGLSTLGSSNYLEWSGNTNAGYTGGDASSSTDSGSTFSADTAQDLHFVVEDTRTTWQRVMDRDWRIVTDSTRRFQLLQPAMPQGCWPVRLTGQRKPADLSADTTTCELDGRLVQQLAHAIWLERRDGDGKWAQYYRALVSAAIESAATPMQGRVIEVV